MKKKIIFLLIIFGTLSFFCDIYANAEGSEKQEIASLRTINRKVYKKSNNKYEISYFGNPVHYWDGQGYEEFDLSFEETQQSYRTSNSNYSLSITKDFSLHPSIELDYLGNYPFSISFNKQLEKSQTQQNFSIEKNTFDEGLLAKSSKINYENSFFKYSVFQLPFETRINAEIECNLYKNQYCLNFDLNYFDLRVEKENSELVFYNNLSIPIYRIGKLTAETSNGELLYSKSLELIGNEDKVLQVKFESPRILNKSNERFNTTLILENELNRGIDFIRDKTITINSSEVLDTDVLMAGIDPLPSIDEMGNIANLEKRSIIELNLPYYHANEVERAVFSLTKSTTGTAYHSNPNIYLYQVLNKDFESINGKTSYMKAYITSGESSNQKYNFNLTEEVKNNIEEKRSILLSIEGEPVTGAKVGCAKFIASNQMHGAIPTFTLTLSEELGASLYGAAKEYIPTQSKSFNCFSYALSLNEGFLTLGWENGAKPTSIKPSDYQSLFIPAAIASMNKKKIEVRILKGGIDDPIFPFERRICFRAGSFKRGEYLDFHFMKQHNDGRWSHKPGSLPSILLANGQTPDNISWHSVDQDLYDSPITYFSIC